MQKLVPDPFLKNEYGAYFWINSLKFYTVCFYYMASWGLSKYIETELQFTCFRLILSSFLKKIGLEPVTLSHFPHSFWTKMILLLRSINWLNFIVWLPLLCEILEKLQMCIGQVCKPVCNVMNFEINLAFPIKLFFLHDQNIMTKT